MLPSREAYELWAETYPPFAHNPLMRAEQEVVSRHLAESGATRALDVGTGSGRYAALLTEMRVPSVVGADLSLGMLRRNRTTRRVCADAHCLPLRSASFDLVNASLVAGDIVDLAAWIAELSRVLETGGHLVYSDFHPLWDRRGWRRTFRTADGTKCALPRASHTMAGHREALAGAGLDLIAADEVRVRMDRRWLGRFWPDRLLPMAMVFHARKVAH